jgi:hypothetical protein
MCNCVSKTTLCLITSKGHSKSTKAVPLYTYQLHVAHVEHKLLVLLLLLVILTRVT